jgi:hypothetical protein
LLSETFSRGTGCRGLKVRKLGTSGSVGAWAGNAAALDGGRRVGGADAGHISSGIIPGSSIMTREGKCHICSEEIQNHPGLLGSLDTGSRQRKGCRRQRQRGHLRRGASKIIIGAINNY